MEVDKWAKAYAKLLKDTGQKVPEKYVFDVGYSATMGDHIEHIDDAYNLVKHYYSIEGGEDGDK